jgi:hypothetical protein
MYAVELPIPIPATAAGAALRLSMAAAHRAVAGTGSKLIARSKHLDLKSRDPVGRTELIDFRGISRILCGGRGR